MDPKIVVFQGNHVKLMIALNKNICAITRKPKSKTKKQVSLIEVTLQKM
jgi:hypothetical protein